MAEWLVRFVGLALGSALVVTALGVLVLRLAGRRPRPAAIVLALLTLFFLGLTQFPLPDPATMTCPQPDTDPRLLPFNFARRLVGILATPDRAVAELIAFGPAAALMNLLLCIAIGAALARAAGSGGLALAALFGATLTLTVEFTQLTGFWGLYPCPWRQFDLDDLVLNLAGVMLGFWAMRRIGRPSRRQAPGSPRGQAR